VDGQAVYPLGPDEFAREMTDFAARFGLNAVGGCCGTTPAHIRTLVQVLGARKPRPRTAVPLALASSGMTTAGLVQNPPPMLIGERLNAQGSKKMKELLLAEDYDGIAALGREQIDGGAHTLDICVAMTERRDEAYLMSRVVRKLSQTVEAPLVIDTTEAEVLEVALEAAPGRVIVNAVNMENGRQRLDAMLPLVRDYGAATIALTIDERGMARTAERKLEIARRIYDIATREYGLLPDALIFDALTFTLATGDPESASTAAETIEGIRRIKAELPGVLTSLGVSNVSYGFKPAARAVLNSVFLYHCVQAGLDMAIVNPKGVTPYADIPPAQRDLAEDLLFNRRPDATARFAAFYEGARARQASAADPTAKMSPAERLHWRILHRQPEGCEADVDALVAEGVREVTGIANHEGGRRQVRLRRADPAVRPAVGRGDEARGFTPRAIPREERGRLEGARRAGDGLWRRARHRQEPDQDHPRQQRLQRARPREAGSSEHHRGRGNRAEGGRDWTVGAPRVDVEADAAGRARAGSPRPAGTGAGGRGRDQPRVQPRHHLHRRPPVRGRRPLLS
jgi:hypothetical protein